MSAQEFQAKPDLLSFADRPAVIECLAKSLKNGVGDEDGFCGNAEARSGLDEATAEFERGEYETFRSFDEFKAAMGYGH